MEEQTKNTIIFENSLIDKIQKMAKEADRDFSGQVRYMLKQYIKMKEDE